MVCGLIKYIRTDQYFQIVKLFFNKAYLFSYLRCFLIFLNTSSIWANLNIDRQTIQNVPLSDSLLFQSLGMACQKFIQSNFVRL